MGGGGAGRPLDLWCQVSTSPILPRAGGIVLLAGLGTSPSLFTWLPPDDGTLGGSCRVSGPQLHGFLAPASSKMWVTPSHCGLL